MSTVRSTLLAAAALVTIAALASQLSLPGPLQVHTKAMAEATSIVGTIDVQPISGTPKTVNFKFLKPNQFYIDSEERTVVGDGKDVYRLDKKSNSYVVESYNERTLAEAAGEADTWAFASFFDKDQFKTANAKLGPSKTLKGEKVDQVNVSWEKPTPVQVTVYFHNSGPIKGWNHKLDDLDVVCFVQTLKVGENLSASEFTFVPPPGSKKAETTAAAKGGHKAVQAILNRACGSCHGSRSPKAGLDLSSYESITSDTRAVSPGNPEQSGIYTTTSGPNHSMPKNGSPLTSAQTKTIHDWIKDGAKRD